MEEDLGLPTTIGGRVVRHVAGDDRPRPHRHAELEVNLVTRGTATYLVGDRRYDLTPGTLVWLFPGQDHVLVDESDDHQLWWAVFRPALVAGAATAPHARLLLDTDPAGVFSRRVPFAATRRLAGLFADVLAAEAVDATLHDAALSYLLLLAWQAFVSSDDVVAGVHVHPAVERTARRLAEDPHAGDLATLARAVALSPSHLSRLFAAQMGTTISRFRNQQRLARFVAAYDDGRRTTALAAAHEAGFGSYAQFYRVHREAAGHGPAGVTTPGRGRGSGRRRSSA